MMVEVSIARRSTNIRIKEVNNMMDTMVTNADKFIFNFIIALIALSTKKN